MQMPIVEWLTKWIGWTLGAPRLRVRVMRDPQDSTEVGCLQFEVENIGRRPTSLHPHLRVTYWYPRASVLTKARIDYDVREVDRELAPFKARVFSATPRHLPPGHGHGWFRTYAVSCSTGERMKVRVRNALLEPLGRWQFQREFWTFKLRGRLHSDELASIHDLQALKRSQGPH